MPDHLSCRVSDLRQRRLPAQRTIREPVHDLAGQRHCQTALLCQRLTIHLGSDDLNSGKAAFNPCHYVIQHRRTDGKLPVSKILFKKRAQQRIIRPVQLNV